MRFFRLMAITVLLLACVVLGSACTGATGAEGPQGPEGDPGTDGVGVENIVNNGDGTFTVNLTNGESYTTDDLTGPQGPQGVQGVQGEEGPQGLPGEAGLPGAGVAWQGEWDNATTYSLNDAVGYQGSSYISKLDGNTGVPPTDADYWDLWVERGEAGPQGPQGEQGIEGPQGEPGPNMIVAAGVISHDGTVKQGYNVTTCVQGSYAGEYFIQLTGITFDDAALWHYVVLVTPAVAPGLSTTYTTYEGLLEVFLWSVGSGVGVNTTFSFMVLDPTLA